MEKPGTRKRKTVQSSLKPKRRPVKKRKKNDNPEKQKTTSGDSEEGKQEPWFVYWIHSTSSNDTYIGSTNDINRRPNEHGKTSKSAKYTKGQEWEVVCFVSGFRNRREACQFEKKWQMLSRRRAMLNGRVIINALFAVPRASTMSTSQPDDGKTSRKKKEEKRDVKRFNRVNCKGFPHTWINRLNHLVTLVNMERWTKNAVSAAMVPLVVNWRSEIRVCPITSSDLPLHVSLSLPVVSSVV